MSAPEARTSPGFIAFTVAAVPTGMKAGVRIFPRRIAISPSRALPSVAWIVKWKRSGMAQRPALRHVLAQGGTMANEALRDMATHRGFKLVGSRRRKPGGDFGLFGLTDAGGEPVFGIEKGALKTGCARPGPSPRVRRSG